MAITAAYLRDKQGAKETPDATDFTEVWIGKSNDVADDMADFGASPLVPGYGSPHADWPNFRVSNREFRNQSEARPILCEIVLTYSRNFDVAKLEAKEIDPLSRDMEVTREAQEVDVPLLRDAITNAILRNTAGTIIGGQTTKIILRVYRVTVNVDSLVPFEDKAGKVNDGDVTIWGETWPAKTVRLGVPRYHSKRSDLGVTFYRCTYEVVCDPRKHVLTILSAGVEEKVNGKPRPITVEGQHITQPVPLDSTGRPIPPAVLDANPDTAPVYLEFNRFQQTDMTSVPLPSSVV